MLLPTSFLPPVSYFSLIVSAPNFSIEHQEHFVKQTIRNHCEIQSANGRLKLSVPVKHDNRWKIPIETIAIASGEQWQRKHIRSIRSSYGKSPFYEYYQEEFEAALSQDFHTLCQVNKTMLALTLKWLKITKEPVYTDSYQAHGAILQDYRTEWNEVKGRSLKKYTQVFSDRFAFMEDLSIIDLVFNCGPAAIDYLKS